MSRVDRATAVIGNLLAFVVATMLEIAGCFAFWRWLREGRSPIVAIAGLVGLIGFAAMLTRVDAPFAAARTVRTGAFTSPRRSCG